jgi:EAL domain-containing protein (putative c-di-GMP-specific phosphodiesterase class I)
MAANLAMSQPMSVWCQRQPDVENQRHARYAGQVPVLPPDRPFYQATLMNHFLPSDSGKPMYSAAFNDYLRRLPHHSKGSNLWLDERGRAHGRFVNATLTSTFQAIRTGAEGRITGYDGYARSHSASDEGLHIWKLLDHAGSDDESVALDRLCRLLHVLNFFRQTDAAGLDLYLSVHSRLLAAVASNHGMAFRHILDVLELPHQQIVLQLPLIGPAQRWVLTHVADNYRHNGFRIGVNATTVAQAVDLLTRIRPDAIKLDCSPAIERREVELYLALLAMAREQNCQVIMKRIETVTHYQALQHPCATGTPGFPYHVQGFLFDFPAADLNAGVVSADSSVWQANRALPEPDTLPCRCKLGYTRRTYKDNLAIK